MAVHVLNSVPPLIQVGIGTNRLEQGRRWFNVEAIAVPPASVGVDVLIGQDILSQIVMSWDGPRWKVLLMY
jgi:hypothetical protein